MSFIYLKYTNLELHIKHGPAFLYTGSDSNHLRQLVALIGFATSEDSDEPAKCRLAGVFAVRIYTVYIRHEIRRSS